MFIQTWQTLCSKLFSWSTLARECARECFYNVSFWSEGSTTPTLYVRGGQLPVLLPSLASPGGAGIHSVHLRAYKHLIYCTTFPAGARDTIDIQSPRVSRLVCGQAWDVTPGSTALGQKLQPQTTCGPSPYPALSTCERGAS